jgi:hydrogenase maturation protein HypF
MYEIQPDKLLVVHDAHPQYVSTLYALELGAAEKRAVQHHRAHIASVIAERGAWDQHVLGVSFDGTGYGDDHSIWGGEIFAGSARAGLERVAHLRSALLPGGDAATSYPVQAAAGFLEQLDELPDVTAQPFSFGARYLDAVRLVRKNMRTFPTSSMGRLFDTAAALCGFTRETTFEGQAAMWLENLARQSRETDGYPFPYAAGELDFRPLLNAVIRDRRRGRDVGEVARALHRGIAVGVRDALTRLRSVYETDTVVLSGGVFQNEFLLSDLKTLLGQDSFVIWTNHAVPANDGGISLGQAALAAFDTPEVFGFVGAKDPNCAEWAA